MRIPRMVLTIACLPAMAGCGRAASVLPGGPAGGAPPSTSHDAVRGAVDGPPRYAWPAVVLRVVDGDTLILRIHGQGARVRVIGMDAPETWLRHDCFGARATRALRHLAPPGSTVYAAGDVERYDRYGRRLLYLWTARGAFVEETLVRAGYARAMAVPPDTGHAAVLREAENTARRAGAGRWTACR